MGKRLMIVDDSCAIELQIRQLLEGTEFDVVGYCPDGETAIERYAKLKPDLVTMDIIMPGIDGLEAAQAAIEQYAAVQPDLVTMDIIMQGMDGLDAAEIILKDHPDARIVMISSLAYDGTIHEAEAIGAKGFLAKPFSEEDLIDTLRNALKD